MIRLRGVDEKEVVEMAPTTVCQLIDGLHYVETKEIRRIGAKTTLAELRAFEMVEVVTGFEDDDERPSIMSILPKNRDGIAALIATSALMLGAVGCGSGATYHYSYTCYGEGCAPPPVAMNLYVPQMPPAQASVIYVDRPVEVRVRHDGTIATRRAAMPQWRK